MLGIMRKDFLSIVLIPNLTFIGLALLVWFGYQGEYDPTMSLMMNGWIYIFVFGGIIGVEHYETRFNGYRFMSALPLTAKEIIGGKAVLALVSVLIMGVGYRIAFSPLFVDPSARSALLKLAIVNSGLVLVLVGFLYFAAFKLGFSKFYALLWTVIGVVGVGPIIGLELFKEDILELLERFAQISVTPVIALSLAMFAGLVFAANKAKEGQATAD